MNSKNIIPLVTMRSLSLIQSWGWAARLFWLTSVIVLGLCLTVLMMMRTPLGIQVGLGLIDTKDSLVQYTNNLFAPDIVVSSSQDVVNSIASRPLSSTDWVKILEEERLTSQPIIVYFKNPLILTERQSHLFSIQNIQVTSWDGTTLQEKKLNLGQFWVQFSEENNSWQISGVLSDLMSQNKKTSERFTDLDLIKIILWSDSLSAQEQWLIDNPPPDFPEEFQSQQITVQVVPSEAAIQQMFWSSSALVLMLIASLAMLMSFSSWENLRKEGVFEPLSSLPSPMWMLPASYILSWSLLLGCIIFVSTILSFLFCWWLAVPFVFFDIVKWMAICWACSLCAMFFIVMTASWYNVKGWKLWVGVIASVAVILVQIFYMIAKEASVPVFLFTSTPLVVLMFCFLLGLSFVFALLSGKRLERQHRQGMKVLL